MLQEIKGEVWISWETSRTFAECSHFRWLLAMQLLPQLRTFETLSRLPAWNSGMTPVSHGLGAGSRQEVSESNTLNEWQFHRLSLNKTGASSSRMKTGYQQGLGNKKAGGTKSSRVRRERAVLEESQNRCGYL